MSRLSRAHGLGLGGDCYALLWDPKLAKLVGLAGSGRSPKSLSLETVRARSKNGLIPAVRRDLGLDAGRARRRGGRCTERYGRLKWAELFESAIHLCESGVPVPQIIAFQFGQSLDVFRDPASGVEEWANAMRTYAPTAVRAQRRRDLPQSGSRANATARSPRAGATASTRVPSRAPSMPTSSASAAGSRYEDLRAQHAEWVEPL